MSSDPVTDWIEELSTWVDQNAIVLELVYGWVLENDEWPEIEKLDQWLWQQGHRKILSVPKTPSTQVMPRAGTHG